ncbi:unnamed protein product [Haemonchus placei]|uniref:Uncharacterized protein n=1 Tax=Haemonchus placei TaxID=6290 RepID=A0A0N4WY11_HAEPC|nr:unnamed protein product [Haemonchus placei]
MNGEEIPRGKGVKNEIKLNEAPTQKPTRLERAKAAIEVMEKRLDETKKVQERLKNLDTKLDQVNKEMENAYIKIKDQLTRAEVGHQHRKDGTPSATSNLSYCSTVSGRESNICSIRPSYSRAERAKESSASIEGRLFEMERALKRLDNIEKSLAKSVRCSIFYEGRKVHQDFQAFETTG